MESISFISDLLKSMPAVSGSGPFLTIFNIAITRSAKITVNRATFIHKDSREQYELKTHKRLIDISEVSPSTIDSLTNLHLPAGVDIEIKMVFEDKK